MNENAGKINQTLLSLVNGYKTRVEVDPDSSDVYYFIVFGVPDDAVVELKEGLWKAILSADWTYDICVAPEVKSFSVTRRYYAEMLPLPEGEGDTFLKNVPQPQALYYFIEMDEDLFSPSHALMTSPMRLTLPATRTSHPLEPIDEYAA